MKTKEDIVSDNGDLLKGEMDFLEHLGELRGRLLYILGAVFFGSVIAYLYSQELFFFLSRPFTEAFPGHKLIGTGPAEAFVLKIKAAAFAGVILSSPVIFFQLWKFIEPGLYKKEKKVALPFISVATFFFLLGVLFCYFVVLPFAYQFFREQYLSISVSPTIRISEHISLIIKALLGFGVVFETPLLAYFLGRAGLINHLILIQWSRHAIVVIFIISALLTPPDVLTQFLMAGPLILLYLLSIAIVKLTNKED